MKTPCPRCTELNEYEPGAIVVCHYCKWPIQMLPVDELSEDDRQIYTDELVRLRLKAERKKARQVQIQQAWASTKTAFRTCSESMHKAVESQRRSFRKAQLEEARRQAKQRRREQAGSSSSSAENRQLPADSVARPKEPSSEPKLNAALISVLVAFVASLFCSGLALHIIKNAPSHGSYETPMSYDEFRDTNNYLNDLNAQGYSDYEIQRAVEAELRRRGEY